MYDLSKSIVPVLKDTPRSQLGFPLFLHLTKYMKASLLNAISLFNVAM